MCGRFGFNTPPEVIARVFQLSEVPSLKPRFNISPTQSVATIRIFPDQAGRKLDLLHWGLIPAWSKDPKIGNRMINARAETVHEKPSFRSAFKRRRCLIPASGFYEWKKEGKMKQPFYIRMKDELPFALAGLWEHWVGEGQTIDSCTIITTSPNDLMREVHDRMPVILDPRDFDMWLDPGYQDVEKLKSLFSPFDQDKMVSFPVSLHVNSPKNDDPKCITPGP